MFSLAYQKIYLYARTLIIYNTDKKFFTVLLIIDFFYYLYTIKQLNN